MDKVDVSPVQHKCQQMIKGRQASGTPVQHEHLGAVWDVTR